MVENRKSIISINPYRPGKPIEEVKKEYGLKEVVKLASNENPRGTSKLAIEAIKNSLMDINYYPDGSCAGLRAALAEKLLVKQDEILFGTGTDEVISMISQAFIETGDEMITADVTFGQYKSSVDAIGGKTVIVPVKEYAFNLSDILDAINPKTKIIFIANPNNPTGTFFGDDEKIKFLNNVPKNTLVVFDEAYEEYVETNNYTCSVPLIKKYDNLIVLKTFSKIYGLASLRVGYGIMNKHYKDVLERIRKPFNVSIPAQAAALACLNDANFVNTVKAENIENKHYCYKVLDEMGLEYVKSEANFILINVNKDCHTVFEELMKKGYIVRPIGLKTHLRVTIGTNEQMVGFFSALKEVLSK